ncbi:MAG: hypothetical protein ABIH59_00485 [archaeon]
MAKETILQHWVLTKFVYPFLLIFIIVFGVLEKTKLFGDGKKQLNAIAAFVVGLIFVAVLSPKDIINNLILFLSIALVVVFIVLLLWGFVTGGEAKFDHKAVKIIAGILIIIAVLVAVFVATGVWDEVYDTLFKQDWSEDLWTNVIFIFVIAGAITAVLLSSKSKS